MRSRITPLLLTLNEAPNVRRTIDRLAWASDIVVVDSDSTDATRELLAAYPNVRIFVRPFTTHAEQWNFGLEQTGITTDWVLALDADFVVSDALLGELDTLSPADDVAGFRASFDYCLGGKPLRGAAYPPVTVLYRRAASRYVDDGHTQRIQVKGRVVPLAGRIFHDDRKPLSAWLAAQSRYMRIEARKIAGEPSATLSWPDRLRKLIVVAPPAMFVYCYLFKGGVLDGRAGLFYSLQRLAAELILSLYLLELAIGLDASGRD